MVAEKRRALRQASPGGLVRRSTCVAVVLVAHGGLLWALSLRRIDPASPSASAPIELDLSPMPEPASLATDAAPAPATLPTSPPAVPEPAVPEHGPPPANAMPAPAMPPAAAPPEPAPAPAAPATTATVPKPATRPAPWPTKQAPAIASHRPQASAPPAPAAAAAALAAPPAAAPSPPAAQGDANAVPAWQGRLAGQLQRAKRYPDIARAAGEEGSATVSFTLDRDGQVLAARLVRSSGSPALDEEAVALVHRAEPLLPPPAELAGRTITLTVPIRFTLR